ncbi:MAG: FAD-binding protein, partial [Spirochaetota bacterium]
MSKGERRRDYEALPVEYRSFHDAIADAIPETRVFLDPLRVLAWGTDAGFYRLIPKIVVKARSPEEISLLLRVAHEHAVPLTFRAAGTSLSGQAVSDSVLVVLAGG